MDIITTLNWLFFLFILVPMAFMFFIASVYLVIAGVIGLIQTILFMFEKGWKYFMDNL